MNDGREWRERARIARVRVRPRWGNGSRGAGRVVRGRRDASANDQQHADRNNAQQAGHAERCTPPKQSGQRAARRWEQSDSDRPWRRRLHSRSRRSISASRRITERSPAIRAVPCSTRLSTSAKNHRLAARDFQAGVAVPAGHEARGVGDLQRSAAVAAGDRRDVHRNSFWKHGKCTADAGNITIPTQWRNHVPRQVGSTQALGSDGVWPAEELECHHACVGTRFVSRAVHAHTGNDKTCPRKRGTWHPDRQRPCPATEVRMHPHAHCSRRPPPHPRVRLHPCPLPVILRCRGGVRWLVSAR
jgi:hypothetical protein